MHLQNGYSQEETARGMLFLSFSIYVSPAVVFSDL